MQYCYQFITQLSKIITNCIIFPTFQEDNTLLIEFISISQTLSIICSLDFSHCQIKSDDQQTREIMDITKMICEVNHRLNKVSYEETKTIIQQQKLVEQLNMNRQKEMKHYEEEKRKQEQEEIQRKEIEKQKIIEENKKREIEEIERKRKEIELNQKKIKEQQMNMKLNQPIGKNLEMNNLPILNEMTDLMDYDDNIDGNSHFKQ